MYYDKTQCSLPISSPPSKSSVHFTGYCLSVWKIITPTWVARKACIHKRCGGYLQTSRGYQLSNLVAATGTEGGRRVRNGKTGKLVTGAWGGGRGREKAGLVAINFGRPYRSLVLTVVSLGCFDVRAIISLIGIS